MFFYIDFRLAKESFYCSRYKVKTFLNSISIDIFKSRLATLSLKWMTQKHGWKHFESCFHRNFANLDNVFNNTICYLLWRVPCGIGIYVIWSCLCWFRILCVTYFFVHPNYRLTCWINHFFITKRARWRIQFNVIWFWDNFVLL